MPRINLTVVLACLLATAHAAQAQEKSVNPGINKSFDSPNIPEFVERFEKEGRDAFDHRNEIVAALGLKPGMAVADVGAGTGLFTRMFSPLVGESGKVYAVDISSEFVAHVLKAARQQNMRNIVGVVCKPDSTLPSAPNAEICVFVVDVSLFSRFSAGARSAAISWLTRLLTSSPDPIPALTMLATAASANAPE